MLERRRRGTWRIYAPLFGVCRLAHYMLGEVCVWEHKPLMIPLFSFIVLILVGHSPLLSAVAELWHHSVTDSFY